VASARARIEVRVMGISGKGKGLFESGGLASLLSPDPHRD
jgi:hypothetical protein